jgi:hypothetical protein
MCHIVPIYHFCGGLKGFLIHFVSHHSYLCGVEVYHAFYTYSFLNISCIGLIIRELQLRILLMEKYMGLIPLSNRMVRKNWTSSSTTENREYAKIRELQLRILLMGFNPIIESNGKKESDFFFNHK